MTHQRYRTHGGYLINRNKPLSFRFNNTEYSGFEGDTLASALLANGVHLVGRSFKYHRPRGIFTVGSEEPNALVRLGRGAQSEPNTRCTVIELFDGLEARSQNCWPSVSLDIRALHNVFSRYLPAGFYYKTFMYPARFWPFYERVIRNAAGMGRVPQAADPSRYQHRHRHCDVLVVGAGAAGLVAARDAANAGLRVILIDERPQAGGALLQHFDHLDHRPAMDWIAAMTKELAARDNVTVLLRTTAFGVYDHRMVGAVERITDHLGSVSAEVPRQRLWMIRCARLIMATGAIERPLVFGNNDRPGIMLASAARSYVRLYGVRPGDRAVLYANNDSAYAAALDLKAAGMDIAALVDSRPGNSGESEDQTDRNDLTRLTEQAGIRILRGHAVVDTLGGQRVRGVKVSAISADGSSCTGSSEQIACDLVCSSGGWTPTVHLFSQAGGRLAFDEELATFVPAEGAEFILPAGAVTGASDLARVIEQGATAAQQAVSAFSRPGQPGPLPACAPQRKPAPLMPLWLTPIPAGSRSKCFVDLQDDVTHADIECAAREGMHSVEHTKRYTTLGMGTDQGKTSNVNGLAILAAQLGKAIVDVGTTKFRPPYTPVTVGAMAGDGVGKHYAPIRRSPLHDWHCRAGAEFLLSGPWMRARYYTHAGESMAQAVYRESKAVRSAVGLVDTSTLGKIDIQGPDAAELLNRVYINNWATLKVGFVRYGAMLREDGRVMDDGTTTRLADQHYYLTTTSANAVTVMSHLEYCHQVLWPELDVYLTSVSEQWGAMAIAGPRARAVLAKVVEETDVSHAALPFMGYCETRIGGQCCRLLRISFSGELAFEIHVPADYTEAVWERVLQAGRTEGITVYGNEALNVLRVEKGHCVIGTEIDGRTTPHDLGLGRMVSTKKDYIGRRTLASPALTAPGRKQLVGLKPLDGKTPIPAGGQIIQQLGQPTPVPMLGHVTASVFSAELNEPVALALLKDGRSRLGESLIVSSPLSGQDVAVEVTSPCFIDQEGERLHV